MVKEIRQAIEILKVNHDIIAEYTQTFKNGVLKNTLLVELGDIQACCFLNEDWEAESIVNHVIKVIKAKRPKFDIPDLKNNLDKIIPVLYKDVEKDKTIYIPEANIYKCFCFIFDFGNILITKEILKTLEISLSDLKKIAEKNIDNYATLRGLSEMRKDNTEKTSKELRDELFLIVSTTKYTQGAGGIFSKKLQKQLKEIYPEGYIIIPSSRHELLIFRNSEIINKTLIESMIKGVNQEVVDPVDELSNNAYILNRGKLQVY